MDIHVGHATFQATLDRLRMPAENIHDEGPAQTGKEGPCILLNAGAPCGRYQ